MSCTKRTARIVLKCGQTSHVSSKSYCTTRVFYLFSADSLHHRKTTQLYGVLDASRAALTFCPELHIRRYIFTQYSYPIYIRYVICVLKFDNCKLNMIQNVRWEWILRLPLRRACIVRRYGANLSSYIW